MYIQDEHLGMLIIDMQNAFLHSDSPLIARGEDNRKYQKIIPNIKALSKTARAHGIPVIYIRHAYLPNYADGGILVNEIYPEDKETGLWLDGSFSAEIYEELAPEPEDFIIRKCRYSSFFGTNLDQLLRNLGVNSLIITGIHTNCCCDSTTRDAAFRDYRVYFMSDGTASFEEDLHNATLKNVALNFGKVRTVGEMIEHIEQQG